MRSKSEILDDFSLFSVPVGGIGSWLTESTHDDIFERLGRMDEEPLSAVQLNQLLVLGHEAPVGDGFFRYYWLQASERHPYRIRTLSDFSEKWLDSHEMILCLAHLKWGLYRLYVDALLYFGNVRTAFRSLRDLSLFEIEAFFESERFDTEAIKRRGPPLPLKSIAKDRGYLISEMACKSYGDPAVSDGDLRTVLVEGYKAHCAAGNPSPTIRELLENRVPQSFQVRQQEFIFSADEVLDESITSEAELSSQYERIASKFTDARNAALDNTRYYLSMLNDLDVYVATSMRSRNDFRTMAETCERIFTDHRLKEMNLRYFDPTLSAARGHEDKGLIECLMVKCASVLVYCAGDKESYGKDAEAAMALSLGKPVIFYCDQEQRGRFYRDIHPLSRLIEFETGVAVGAMVTDNLEELSELIYRILENRMEYCLEQSKPGFLRLKDKLTGSVVRPRLMINFLARRFGTTTTKIVERGARASAMPERPLQVVSHERQVIARSAVSRSASDAIACADIVPATGPAACAHPRDNATGGAFCVRVAHNCPMEFGSAGPKFFSESDMRLGRSEGHESGHARWLAAAVRPMHLDGGRWSQTPYRNDLRRACDSEVQHASLMRRYAPLMRHSW